MQKCGRIANGHNGMRARGWRHAVLAVHLYSFQFIFLSEVIDSDIDRPGPRPGFKSRPQSGMKRAIIRRI
jgi:hypothetical protein